MRVDIGMLDAFRENVVEVELPEGWRRVWRGAVKPGDRWLNRLVLLHDGIAAWEDVELPLDTFDRKNGADSFCCLIRRGDGDVDLPCERCEFRVREVGKRFCWKCCDLVIAEIRASGAIS